jgi:hypothetical protein
MIQDAIKLLIVQKLDDFKVNNPFLFSAVMFVLFIFTNITFYFQQIGHDMPTWMLPVIGIATAIMALVSPRTTTQLKELTAVKPLFETPLVAEDDDMIIHLRSVLKEKTVELKEPRVVRLKKVKKVKKVE